MINGGVQARESGEVNITGDVRTEHGKGDDSCDDGASEEGEVFKGL